VTARESDATVRELVAAIAGEPPPELERAIAGGVDLGAGHGIAALERLAADPRAGPAVHAALGHFLAVVGRSPEAAAAYRRALSADPGPRARALLERHLAALG
jgi:predicted RNA polymerase sigma factor